MRIPMLERDKGDTQANDICFSDSDSDSDIRSMEQEEK